MTGNVLTGSQNMNTKVYLYLPVRDKCIINGPCREEKLTLLTMNTKVASQCASVQSDKYLCYSLTSYYILYEYKIDKYIEDLT